MSDEPKTAREIMEWQKNEEWMKRQEFYRRALAENPNAGGLYIDKDGSIGGGTYPSDDP